MAEKIGLEAALDLGAWNSSIDKYIGGVKKMDTETGKTAGALGKAFDSMGKSVLSVTGMMGKALAGAAVAAGAGIAAFTVNGIKGAAELEAQLSTVAAVLGKTTAEIEPLKAAVYDLALNPNLKVSVDEAASAFEMLATNGLTMEQIIGGAAEATVLLANATKADFGTAADIATSAMSVFNIEAKDMMGAVNGIVGVTNASKFTINDYALALSQGGGVASAVGVEFRDFNTSIAAMAPLFGSGSDAGTSFKTMLQRLVPQSEAASDAMQQLGLFSGMTQDEFEKTEATIVKYKEQLAKLDPESKNFAARSEELNSKISVLESSLVQGQNAFYNMDGSMKSMNEITVLLNGALSGLSDEQRTAALSTIFGSDAMRAAVALGESGAVVYTDLATASKELGISQDDLRKYMEGGITAFEVMEATMAQTDALENAKTNTDNFKSALGILTDTIDAVGRQVGDLFLPYLKQAALALADLASNAGPVVIAAFQDLIDTFTNLSSYFQLVAEDGDTLNDFLANLPPSIQPIIEIMGGLLVVFQDFRAGALGVDYPWEDVFPPWLANTAYALSAAVVFITDNLAAFQGAIVGVGAVLAAAGIYQMLLGLAAAIAALNLPMLAIIATAALVGAAWNANWFGIRDTTLAVINALTAAFFPLTSAIADFGSIALEEIIAFATGTETEFGALALIWDGLKISVGNAFGGIVATITGLLPVWGTILAGWGAAAVSWITAAIPTATAAVGEYTSGLIAKLTEADWAGTGTNMMTLLTSAVETARGVLYTVFANIVITVVAILDAIPWSTIGTNMMTLLTGAVETAKGLLFVAFANIMITIQGIWNSIDWTALGNDLLTKVRNGVETARGALVTLFAGMLVTIQGIWNSIDWTALGSDLLTKVRNGVDAARGALVTLFAGMLVTIRGVWDSIDWTALGNTLLTKIRDGVESARGALVTLFSNMLVTIRGVWNSIDWTQLGNDILTKIRDGVETARGALVTAFANMMVTIRGVWDSVDWIQLGKDILTYLRDGFEQTRDELVERAKEIAKEIKDAFDKTDWSTVGLNIASGIGKGLGIAVGGLFLIALGIGEVIINGIKAGIELVKSKFFSDVGDVATGAANEFTKIEWGVHGQAVIDGIKAGVDAAKAGFLEGFNQIAGDVVKQFEDIEWTVLGANIINSIKSGITIAAGALLTLMQTTAQNAWNRFTSIDFVGAGKAIIDGVISGISSASSSLYQKMKQVAEDAWQSFKEGINMGSPSRLFAIGGRAIVDGIIMGIEQRSGALNKTIGSLVNADSYSAAATQFRNLVGSISALSGQTGDSQKDLLAELDKVGKEMDARFGVLKLLGDAGLNPALLGDLAKQPLDVILSQLTPAVEATVKSLRQKLVDEQARMVREFALAPILESLDAAIDKQAKKLSALSSVTLSGFLGRAGSIISNQLDSITTKIKEARDAFMGTGDRGTLDRLLGDREKLMAQMESITKRAGNSDTENALKAQLELIKEAQALGVSVTGMSALKDGYSMADLLGLSDLEAQVAAKRLDALRKQIADTITGNEKALKIEKELAALSEFDAKLKSVQAATGKRYYDQVLAPIYAKLQDTTLLDAQRVDLMAQYRKEAQRIQQLQQREAQADFLAEQVDLLQQVRDLGLDPAFIFKDIKLGAAASISDLMTVTERIANATIAKLQRELGLNGGVNLFERLFGSVDSQQAALDKQRQLLDLVRELGADPNTIFGGESVASASGLSAGVYERLQSAVNFSMAKLRTALAQEQRRLEREFTLQPIIDKLTQQGRQLAQVASTSFTGFMKIAADGLGAQMAKLDTQINGAREIFLTWGSPQAQAELTRLIEERATLVEQMQRLSNAERGVIVNPSAAYEGALKAQLEMLKEARALGASIGGFQTLKSDYSTQDLINLSMIEKVVSAKRIEDIKRQIAQVLYLDGLDTSFDLQTKAGEAYQKRVLEPILANLNSMVTNDTERNRLLAQYNAEARNLIALDQRQLAFEQELTRLRTLQGELAGVQSAFGKRYADDVLGPILEKLESANLLESQRAGLIAQYRAESEKILALKRQEEQLDFLKQQLALIKEVKDNDLNASQIFAGMTLGMNTSIADLLTATQRTIQAMIAKVQGELKISSPSRVFMKIGQQTIDGLRLGVQKAMQQPVMAGSVPHAAVSSRTLNFAMGGVTIQSGMDEVLFESRVQRIIERSLS